MIQLVNTTLREASPLMLVALGALFAYRASVFHIGIEGVMLTGAFSSTAIAVKSGSLALALVGGVGACLILSALFWLIVVVFGANQIIAGIGLSGTALGGTSFALERIFGSPGDIQSPVGLPQPVSGLHYGLAAVFANLSILVWLAPLVVLLCWGLLDRSRFGLRVNAVGEHPFAAQSAGINATRIRLWVLLIAGGLAGLGGIDLALGGLQGFSENMTGGRGYIGLAAVLFAQGRPIWIAVASVFFGLADALGIQVQLWGTGGVPPEFVLMLPFALTIVAVWLSGLRGRKTRQFSAGYLELRN